MQNDVVGGTNIEEYVDEKIIIVIIVKELLFGNATVHYMVIQTGFIDTQGARHKKLRIELRDTWPYYIYEKSIEILHMIKK